MCWKCDNKGSTAAYLELVRGKIHDYGWYVQGVEGDRVHPPWAYTVGLTEHSRPELVLTGMPLDPAADLLGAEAAYQLFFNDPIAGQRFRLRDGPLVEAVPVADPAAHLNTATALYGTTVSAVQLVHADERGHWPWEPGYRGVRGGQPVLGPHT
ncbi:uncharacterized protein DUF4262 [Lentzea atacamensis]|uniref:Uncharacterized protein DUF4262 n=1 Tax=Lentzea atacamensis TaxID=531938 RepID=A0ABX9E4U6_9PSEU|nr:DUF4262 domain-containing protein [Lentzea atacamensis]RAS64064.1 uncharacterized protein DUF4262 [Lentzea atacamensis]